MAINTFLKKTKKLILHPRRFFIDRQAKIERSRQTISNSALSPVQQSTKSKIAQTPKPKVKAYLNLTHPSQEALYKHASKIISSHASLLNGSYRLKQDEILFEVLDCVFIASLHNPIESGTIVKGFMLITYNEDEENPHDGIQEGKKAFLSLIHKINIDHMKSISDFNSLYHYYENRPERSDASQIKYALSAGIYEEHVVSRALTLLHEKAGSLPQVDINLIFRKLYRVLGASHRLESVVIKLAALAKKDNFPVDFLMLLSAFFTESGDYRRAIDLAKRAKSKDKDAWYKNRYLGLMNLLYVNGLATEEWARLDHELYLELEEGEWEFEKYISSNFNELAVVGNSPIEKGGSKGQLIDAHGKVARFNSAITDYPHYLDYGQKTNILIMNPRYYETQRNRKRHLDFIIISDGNLYSSKDLTYKLHDLRQHADRVCLMPRKLDLFLTQNICASPSSGLKFVEWLYMIGGPINRDRVFGFSLTDQGHGVATSYANGRSVGLNTIHNWSSEKEYLENKLITKGSEEVF